MAETITYDPSDDPQALAEAEARDGENLAQGEKMAGEQAELLAGKYKNAEDLEAAYLELQKKMGEGTPDEVSEDVTPEDNLNPYTDDGSVDYDTVEEVYGEQITDVMEKAGIDPWKMATHFNENNGTLSDEMTQQLVDAGFPAETVDAYLKGQAQQQGFTASGQQLSDSDVREIQDLAGGPNQYESLTKWAETNLSQDDVNAFDEVMNTGNKAAVKFAVKALNAQYEDAVGRTPDLVTGRTSTRGDKYRSMAEVVRDMESPQYDADPAYRADVQQKLERSNLAVS